MIHNARALHLCIHEVLKHDPDDPKSMISGVSKNGSFWGSEMGVRNGSKIGVPILEAPSTLYKPKGAITSGGILRSKLDPVFRPLISKKVVPGSALGVWNPEIRGLDWMGP